MLLESHIKKSVVCFSLICLISLDGVNPSMEQLSRGNRLGGLSRETGSQFTPRKQFFNVSLSELTCLEFYHAINNKTATC